MDDVNVSAVFEVRSFARSWDNSDWSFGWRLRTPNLGEEKVVGGRGWYCWKKHWWVPITFPLSFRVRVRVSEILPLLCSSTPLSPTPFLVPKNFPMFPWESVDGLWATKSESVQQIVHAISFQDFQPVWSWSTNVTDRQTDRQTDGRHAKYM